MDQIHPNHLDLGKKNSRYTGIILNLLISMIIDTLGYIPMIKQACQFIGFCTLLWGVFWLFYYISALYKAINCIAATWICFTIVEGSL